jgi:DNA-binding winged helix-turn-helix (wHTH) protein
MKEFLPFRPDTVNQFLWRRCDTGDDERILLTPKAFAVLRYLVEDEGRLVTQDELLDAVWPGVHVQPQVVKSHILDIRSALGDRAKNPLFIETLHRRGYRFIAAVSEGAGTHLAVLAQPARGRLVGREHALGELRIVLGRRCGASGRSCLSRASRVSGRLRWRTSSSDRCRLKCRVFASPVVNALKAAACF